MELFVTLVEANAFALADARKSVEAEPRSALQVSNNKLCETFLHSSEKS